MDIVQKIRELADELNSPAEKMFVVIGVSKTQYEKALNENDGECVKKITDFFEAREHAFSIYDPDQIETIKKIEQQILSAGSQGNFAKLVGLSPAAVSNLRKGKYTGSETDVFKKLDDYLKTKAEQEQFSDIFVPVDYAPTAISRMIYEKLRNVHIQGGCAVITGDAGIGKTKKIQKDLRE